MKKIVVGLVVGMLVAVGNVGNHVSALAAQTDVTGVITERQVAVAGALVTVVCGGATQRDITDGSGSYLVAFQTAQCPFGSTVKVTAQKDGKSGVASDTVRGVTTKLNLAIVNVSIPEYGMIGTLLAGVAGFGFIAYQRRRHKQELQF